MNKQEFLNIMKECLNSEIPLKEVNDNIKFYDEYITNSTSSGKTEEIVMNELGDPRLISKTIIESYKMSNGERRTSNYYYEEDNSDTYANETNEKSKGTHAGFDNRDIRFGKLKLNTWYGKLLSGIVIMITIMGVLVIGGYILSLLLPFILIICLISFIIKIFK